MSKYSSGAWSVGADIGSRVATVADAVAHNRLIGLSCYGAAESEKERQPLPSAGSGAVQVTH